MFIMFSDKKILEVIDDRATGGASVLQFAFDNVQSKVDVFSSEITT